MSKTINEKIQSQKDYIKQQENLLRKLTQQAKSEERTARNNRLIHWGIAIETALKERELHAEPYLTEEQVGAVFAKGLTYGIPDISNETAKTSPVKLTSKAIEDNAENEDEA